MIQTSHLNIFEGKPFGNIMMDSNYSELIRLGFEPGDSVNVCFSNGMVVDDIPFLSGCILPEGMMCLNAYIGFDWVRIEKRFGRVWEFFEMTGKETCRIVLNERGKYTFLQNVFATDFSLSRDCYKDDETYTNYRSLSGGKIRKGRVYRSIASFDPIHNKGDFKIRQNHLDKILKHDGIRFVLNMTCDKSQADTFFESGEYDDLYIKKLYDEGNVYSDMFSADYSSTEFKNALASALRTLIRHTGPYLIQCRAGLDRTGFLCCVLEALAGANQEDIRDDYMRSYESICGVTKESNRKKYEILNMCQVDRILEIMIYGKSVHRNITADDFCTGKWKADEDNRKELFFSAAFAVSAENYLLQCGMKQSEIICLKRILTE